MESVVASAVDSGSLAQLATGFPLQATPIAITTMRIGRENRAASAIQVRSTNQTLALEQRKEH